MNFNTNLVLDLISIEADLKDKINYLIDGELLVSNDVDEFNDQLFIEKITPLIKKELNIFLKNGLSKMGLGIIRSYINLDNIDYKFLLENSTRF